MQRRRASKDTSKDSVHEEKDEGCDDKDAQGEDAEGTDCVF